MSLCSRTLCNIVLGGDRFSLNGYEGAAADDVDDLGDDVGVALNAVSDHVVVVLKCFS